MIQAAGTGRLLNVSSWKVLVDHGLRYQLPNYERPDYERPSREAMASSTRSWIRRFEATMPVLRSN